jgi:hypothetical protein
MHLDKASANGLSLCQCGLVTFPSHERSYATITLTFKIAGKYKWIPSLPRIIHHKLMATVQEAEKYDIISSPSSEDDYKFLASTFSICLFGLNQH